MAGKLKPHAHRAPTAPISGDTVSDVREDVAPRSVRSDAELDSRSTVTVGFQVSAPASSSSRPLGPPQLPC